LGVGRTDRRPPAERGPMTGDCSGVECAAREADAWGHGAPLVSGEGWDTGATWRVGSTRQRLGGESESGGAGDACPRVPGVRTFVLLPHAHGAERHDRNR
jgi:hypothetical protein